MYTRRRSGEEEEHTRSSLREEGQGWQLTRPPSAIIMVISSLAFPSISEVLFPYENRKILFPSIRNKQARFRTKRIFTYIYIRTYIYIYYIHIICMDDIYIYGWIISDGYVYNLCIYMYVCELMKLILLFMYIIFVRILLYINKVDYVRTNEGI